MKKIVITYGIIAGTIVGGLMLASMPLWKSGVLNFDNGQLVGYTTMVIALSVIFFAIKSFRDNHAGGKITFGKGVVIGILITAIASVMYALAWEISFHSMGDEFIQKMTDHHFKELKADGATGAELEKAKVDWASFNEMYKNPVIRFGVTLMEIFPVGLAISLVCAGLLRKKEFLAATSTIIILMATLISCNNPNPVNMEMTDNLKLGAFSVSLTVKDLHASKEFYEKLGFKVLGGDISKNYLIMKNENSIIGLFQGMFDKNILTYNPGWDENGKDIKSFTDIREIQKQLKGKGLKLENEADEKTAGPASFILIDPDGNQILFDQHR